MDNAAVTRDMILKHSPVNLDVMPTKDCLKDDAYVENIL